MKIKNKKRYLQAPIVEQRQQLHHHGLLFLEGFAVELEQLLADVSSLGPTTLDRFLTTCLPLKFLLNEFFLIMSTILSIVRTHLDPLPK